MKRREETPPPPTSENSLRRMRLIEDLRNKGLDSETLERIGAHFITERAEADVLAARKFFGAEDRASPSFSDLLVETTRRLNGLLAAAIGLRECPSDQMIGGMIQLVEDLLHHAHRLEDAYLGMWWLDAVDGEKPASD